MVRRLQIRSRAKRWLPPLVAVGLLVPLLAAYQFSPAGARAAYPAAKATSTVGAATSPMPADDPARGVVYKGLRRPVKGECGSTRLFVITGTGGCTHGPDPAPPGVNLKKSVAPLAPSAADSAAITCDGDGSSGNRTQVAYVRSSDVADRFSTFVASIRQWAADADSIYLNSALETGGVRNVRFVHDPSCNIVVANIVISPAGDDSLANTESELATAGYNRADRKYMLYVDANFYCGIGDIRSDDTPGSSNQNNFGPRYGRSDNGCWSGSVAAHEHMHNLGGVQLTAPHTSGGYHCVDEYDRMCYSDSPNFPTMQILCPDTAHDDRFDCNHDDYYSTSPPVGSYLATHWNAANNSFLIVGGATRTVSGTVRDTSGAALANAKVQLLSGPGTFVTTNGSGVYSIPGVPDGTYQVRALWGCYGPVTQNLVVNGNETLDFSLAKRSDSAGFSCRPTSSSFVSATNVLGLSGDDVSTPVTLPFGFRFQGQNRTVANISTNGVVDFAGPDTAYNNTAIPSPATPNAAIYAFWDDLNVDGSASVLTSTLGSAPNRQFVIEWRNVTFVGQPPTFRFSFEVTLQEDNDAGTNDVITLQYKDIDPGVETGSSATVGIENNDGSSGLQYFANDGILRSGDAIRIAPK